MTEKDLSYEQAGVNIAEGNEFVKDIGQIIKRSWRTGVMNDLGGFAGFFDLKACGFKDPILLSATDGVGTKIELARSTNIYGGLGIDLVAMCVNDLIVHGGQPLFFLDYLASGKLDRNNHLAIVESMVEGCREAGCALIGGETAEMPGVYDDDKFDLAGFCVGAVERSEQMPANIKSGDVILGVSSSGFHSNGYSLIRHAIAEKNIDIDEKINSTESLAEALMRPTTIYVQPTMDCLDRKLAKGFAHITGGGIIENLPRILPSHLAASIDRNLIKQPDVVAHFLDACPLNLEEAYRTFNMGIGFCVICHPDQMGAIAAAYAAHGHECYPIGDVTSRKDDQALQMDLG